MNIAPDTQTDTKWNRPNQKKTEEKNPHNLLGGVYTRSEFIHIYYDEGTRILKREIKRETLFRVVARQQQRRRHILMRLHNNYSMGSINTVSTLLHYCTHFFLYDSSSLMPPSPATLTLSLTCMDRYYLIATKQITPSNLSVSSEYVVMMMMLGAGEFHLEITTVQTRDRKREKFSVLGVCSTITDISAITFKFQSFSS